MADITTLNADAGGYEDWMARFRTSPEDIAAWLRQSFDGAEIEVESLNDRFTHLFRVYDRERSPYPTLLISWEALEDWGFEMIIDDFETSRLIEQLKRQPGVPLVYRRDRSLRPDTD